MFDCNLRACKVGGTLEDMFDPIPIMLASEKVRAAIECPEPEPRRRARRRAAGMLRRLADRLEPAPAVRQPTTS
jgi:hypothetical protein